MKTWNPRDYDVSGMKETIVTPLGKIYICIDGIISDYGVSPYYCDVRSVREKPPAGCYRITVLANNCHTIRCVVALNDTEIPNYGASGEHYLYSEFVKDNVILTIGAGDEKPEFETNRLRYGMEYVLRCAVDRVVFGVAWAVDYGGQYDIRTSLAADPLY